MGAIILLYFALFWLWKSASESNICLSRTASVVLERVTGTSVVNLIVIKLRFQDCKNIPVSLFSQIWWWMLSLFLEYFELSIAGNVFFHLSSSFQICRGKVHWQQIQYISFNAWDESYVFDDCLFWDNLTVFLVHFICSTKDKSAILKWNARVFTSVNKLL